MALAPTEKLAPTPMGTPSKIYMYVVDYYYCGRPTQLYLA